MLNYLVKSPAHMHTRSHCQSTGTAWAILLLSSRMAHADLIQHITIHCCGSSVTALDLVNIYFGKQLSVLQSQPAQPRLQMCCELLWSIQGDVSRSASAPPVFRTAIATPAHSRENKARVVKVTIHIIISQLSHFTSNNFPCLGFDSWKDEDYRFIRGKNSRSKTNTSEISNTTNVYAHGSSSCFYTEGKECQLIIFIHFPLFKYLIVWKPAFSI